MSVLRSKTPIVEDQKTEEGNEGGSTVNISTTAMDKESVGIESVMESKNKYQNGGNKEVMLSRAQELEATQKLQDLKVGRSSDPVIRECDEAIGESSQ